MGEPDKPLTRIDEIKENPAELSEKEWRERLTPDQFYVCRQRGTEPAYVGRYVRFDKKGTYHCMACDAFLFKSDHKYPSNCGWPAFFAARTGDVKAKNGSSGPEVDPGVETVKRREDSSLGMLRTEVSCKVCNSHLGHVFPDGPLPTKERFCINSMAINFRKAQPTSGSSSWSSSRLSSLSARQRAQSPASSRATPTTTTNSTAANRFRSASTTAASCSTSTATTSTCSSSCNPTRMYTCGPGSIGRAFGCGSPTKRAPRPTSVPPRFTGSTSSSATTATTTTTNNNNNTHSNNHSKSTTATTTFRDRTVGRRSSVPAESKVAQPKKTDLAKSSDSNQKTGTSTSSSANTEPKK